MATNTNITKKLANAGGTWVNCTVNSPTRNQNATSNFESWAYSGAWNSGETIGGRLTFTSVDLTTEQYLVLNLKCSDFNGHFEAWSTGNPKVRMTLEDGSGNWASWDVWGDYDGWGGSFYNGHFVSGTSDAFFILNRSRTADASSGTLDWTDIDAIEFVGRVDSTTGADTLSMGFASIVNIDFATIVGTTGNTLLDLADDFADTNAMASFVPGTAMFEKLYDKFAGGPQVSYSIRMGFDFGDGGTTTTTISESNFGLSFVNMIDDNATNQSVGPVWLSTTTARRRWRVNTGASDSITLTDFVASSSSHVDFSCIGNTSGTATFTRGMWVGHKDVTTSSNGGCVLGHGTYTDCIFDDCGFVEIDTNTAMTGVTIRNSASDAKGLYLDGLTGTTVDMSAITGSIDKITINPSADGQTYDFTGITNTAITVVNEHATHGFTITVPSGVTVTEDETAGGLITVSQPTTDITINSSETGSLIQIFTTATQTLIDSTTGTQLVYTYTSSPTYDICVQKAGFLPQRLTGVALTGNSPTYDFTLVADPVYNSSHGLTYTTDFSYNRSTDRLTVSNRNTGRDIYSGLIDAFIAQSALYNTAFNFRPNGPTSIIFLNDAEFFDSTSEDNWHRAGVQYQDTNGVSTAEWVSVIDSLAQVDSGATGEYQQVDGSGTTDARATGAFDQIIKVYGDATHGNFDYRDHLVLKYQVNGYVEARADVLSLFGISAVEPIEYVVAMVQTALAASTGDPAITITITDHGASPVTWNGLPFSITVEGGANSAEDILREIDYNLSLDATYQSKDPFNWPPMIVEAGSNFETARGVTEGGAGAALKGVRVLQSGAIHPGFARFQSDNGTYYTPPVSASISFTGMPTAGANIRLQIWNETAKTASAWAATTAYSVGDKVLRSTGLGSEQTAGLYMVCTTAGTSGGTEPTWDTTVGNTTADGTVTWTTYAILFQDGDPAGASYAGSYTNGEEFITGDNFGWRFAELNGTTSFKTADGSGQTQATGFSVPVSVTANSVYASNAVDGSTVTGLALDVSNVEIDVSLDQDSTNPNLFAFYCYQLASVSAGMYNFWGGVTAIDAGNYRINNDVANIYLDNSTPDFVKQEDSDTSRLFRADGTRPYKDPSAGGGGIAWNWKNPVYLEQTGSVSQTTLNQIDAVTSQFTFTGSRVDASVNAEVVEDSLTRVELERIMLAVAAGDATVVDNGDGTHTVTFESQDGLVNRVVSLATVATGARTISAVSGAD